MTTSESATNDRGPSGEDLNRIATIPNLLSLIRMLFIPVFVILLLQDSKAAELAGLLILGAVVATDWVDGYVATFDLMFGFPLIAWGNFGLPLHRAALLVGWFLYAVGIVLYYVAAVLYAFDLRAALAAPDANR